MQAPDPIDSIMARLMPPGLSDEGQSSMEGLIDELAGPGEANVVPISRGNWGLKVAIGGGIAAAIGGLCALLPLGPLSSTKSRTAANPPARFSELVLLGQSDTAESGRTEVRREGDGYRVKINGPQDQIVFEGDVSPAGGFDQIPDSYRHKVEVLVHTLDQALDGNAVPREPRARGLPAEPEKR